MKFAHLADTHLGCWKDDSLNKLAIQTFDKVMQDILEAKVDFILISGDLFDSSYPKIDILKETARILREVRDAEIPIYIIAGSHDYSPTDKTILKVFESAGLLIDVFKAGYTDENKIKLEFTEDQATGAKITGILGRTQGTDVGLYQELDRDSLEQEEGVKIFLFHNAITELRTKETEFYESFPQSLLPKNFAYYAGGHIHKPSVLSEGPYTEPLILYPGCLFPTEFREVEAAEFGGFYIIGTDEEGRMIVQKRVVHLFDVCALSYNADGKSLETVAGELTGLIDSTEMDGKIVTLRVEGEMVSGSPAAINFRDLNEQAYKNGALNFMRNTQKFTSKNSVIKKPPIGKSRAEIEEKVIQENIGQIKVSWWDQAKEASIITDLLAKCSQRRSGDQNVGDYKAEKVDLFLQILGIKSIWEESEE